MKTLPRFRELRDKGLIEVSLYPEVPGVVVVEKAQFDPETGERIAPIQEMFKIAELSEFLEEVKELHKVIAEL